MIRFHVSQSYLAENKRWHTFDSNHNMTRCETTISVGIEFLKEVWQEEIKITPSIKMVRSYADLFDESPTSTNNARKSMALAKAKILNSGSIQSTGSPRSRVKLKESSTVVFRKSPVTKDQTVTSSPSRSDGKHTFSSFIQQSRPDPPEQVGLAGFTMEAVPREPQINGSMSARIKISSRVTLSPRHI